MTTRKKTAKKTANRGAKSQRGAAKSAKNSATRKGAASKAPNKLEKAALAARKKAAKAKAAAKSASRSVASPKVKAAAKRATSASKSARAPVKNNIDVATNDVAGGEQTKAAPAAIEIKENETLSAVKAKTEAKPSSAVKIPTSIKTPLAAKAQPVAKTLAPAPAKVAAPAAAVPEAAAPVSSPVVALPSAAKTSRPVVSEKPVTQAVEEATPKAAKSAPAAPRHGFKSNEFVVYPAHGVGQIVAVEEQEVAGFRLELFVITFVKDKMMLRVPVGKAASVGMRKLSDPDLVKRALDTLLGRARIKRTMWSRRAQEYEAKINSGDLIAIAEVVRDLYRSEAQPEQSYSERQLYEAALDRMAREVAVVQKFGETEALKAIEGQLQKGPRRGKTDAADAAAEDSAGEAGDTDVEEAA